MQTNSALNLNAEIQKIEKRVPNQVYTLGKILNVPFPNTTSGSRKIMQTGFMEQVIQLSEPEVPIITTSYENQFAYKSSNFITADTDYKVVAKISKFSKNPNNHYWLILYDETINKITMVERCPYYYNTEFYGYLFNNDYLDEKQVGEMINKDDVMVKTISFDEYNNRAEGLNLATMYIACEDVKEDPIIMSESAAKKMACILIDKIVIKINDNDILLNLYGNEETRTYKTFPDIGENVKNSILCAIRRELKDEESLFTQSWDRLKQIMMNDKKFLCDNGTIIDINVYCNNPNNLENTLYNTQIFKYYKETLRFAEEFITKVKPWIDKEGIEVSYELRKMYNNMNLVANKVQYIEDKVFSNIEIEIYIKHNKALVRGDKIVDRYGGKGVVSKVRPDDLMPKYYKNGKWQPVDIMYSMFTCINRLNDGQLFEISITYIGWQLIEFIKNNINDYNEAFALIEKYIRFFNPNQADTLLYKYKYSYNNSPDPMNGANDIIYDDDDSHYNRNIFIESILYDGFIMLSIPPFSSNMSIDKIKEVYEAFPFLRKYCPVLVPQKDSRGNYRMVQTRRPLVVGYKYISRLKQLAEEKFSAVSLASTNTKNENSKSKLFKSHNARYASTPVKIYGEMESAAIASYTGINNFIEIFLLYSSSPEARRQNEELLIGDPFSFDIQLNEDCVAQSADQVQAYLKLLGEKLSFHKIKKFKQKPAMKAIVKTVGKKYKNLVYKVPEEIINKYKDNKDEYGNHIITNEEREELNIFAKQEFEKEKKNLNKDYKPIVKVVPGIKEWKQEEEDYKKKLRSIGVDPKYILK